MNPSQELYPTILRYITEDSDEFKTLADVFNAVNKAKDVQLGTRENPITTGSIAKRAAGLVLTFPVLVSTSIKIDTAIMISKAIERKCVSLLQILFSAMNLSQYNKTQDLYEYISKFHSNLNTGGMQSVSLDDFITAMANGVVYQKNDYAVKEQVEAIMEELRFIANHPAQVALSEYSLNDYKITPHPFAEAAVELQPISEAKSAWKSDLSSRQKKAGQELGKLTQQVKTRTPLTGNMIMDATRVERAEYNAAWLDVQNAQNALAEKRRYLDPNDPALQTYKDIVTMAQQKQNEAKARLDAAQTAFVSTYQAETRAQEQELSQAKRTVEALDKEQAEREYNFEKEMRERAHQDERDALQRKYRLDDIKDQRAYEKERYDLERKHKAEDRDEERAYREKQKAEDRKWEVAEKERQRLQAIADKEKEMKDKAAFDYKIGAPQDAEFFSKQIMDGDIKKANELQPTNMVVQFQILSDDGKYVATQSGVIGVKAKMYPIDSTEMLRRISSKYSDNNWLFNFIRASTGEISFWKDLIFSFDKMKREGIKIAKGSVNAKLFNLLERRAARNNSKFFRSNDANPITTLVISSDEVEYLRKNNNIDLSKPATATSLFNGYNLMGLVIVDNGEDSASFLFDDGEGAFEKLSYTALEREARDNGELKKIINLLHKGGRI